METAADYLRTLYDQIRPEHIVEIGADPLMSIIANSAQGIRKVSVVDFKDQNDYKGGWWSMVGDLAEISELTRIDGDAKSLSSLIARADVVYAHRVLFSADEGSDLWKNVKYHRGEIEMTEEEYDSLSQGFMQAEATSVSEALKVANPGHVIWFTDGDGKEFFEQVASRHSRSFQSGTLIEGIGRFPDRTVDYFHLSNSQK